MTLSHPRTPRTRNTTQWLLGASLGVAALGLTLATRSADADPREEARYPYDPACAWGRLANGRGMLVRCLTQAEAAGLATGKPKPVAAAPAAPSAAPPAAPTASEAPPEKPPAPQNVSANLVQVLVDEGKLPAAEKRLREANDRYAECVTKHGGLSQAKGEVHVRFLVRGVRGRAEGVSVQRRVGVGADAAQCVAHVVDRRWVGTPEAPLVGATAVVRFERR